VDIEMTLQDVHTNKEVLVCAIVDGINRFFRDFANPQGPLRLDPSELDETLFNKVKYRVAEEVAAKCEHCQIDEDA
jgi:hypothetical protein